MVAMSSFAMEWSVALSRSGDTCCKPHNKRDEAESGGRERDRRLLLGPLRVHDSGLLPIRKFALGRSIYSTLLKGEDKVVFTRPSARESQDVDRCNLVFNF